MNKLSKKRKFENNDSEEEIEINETLNIKTKGHMVYFYEDVNKHSILELINQLKDLEIQLLHIKELYDVNPVIKLHIYSNGGDAFMGLSAYDFIKSLKLPVYTYIDGLIASAATFIFLSGTKRFMSNNGTVLIHQISTCFWGKFEDLKDEIKNVNELMNICKRIYKDNTGLKKKEINKLLKRESYLNYEECLRIKFITE